jgi:addiction module HigA family antidote
MAIERKCRPSEPGDLLVELFLKDRKISLTDFAKAIGCTRKHMSNIVHGKARIEAELATRIGTVLGTTAQIWLDLQAAVDLWDAKQKLKHWKPAKKFLHMPARDGDAI